MNFIIENGVVAANSKLPKFKDLFAGFINPLNVKISDTFSKNFGNLSGRLPDVTLNNLRWILNAGDWTVKNQGYVSIDSGGTSSAQISHLTTGKIAACVELGENLSWVGVVFRSASNTNQLRVVLNPANGGILIQKVINGSASSISSAIPVSFVIGKKYILQVDYDESGFDIYLDGVHKGRILTSDLSENTGVGIGMGSINHKIWEFIAE